MSELSVHLAAEKKLFLTARGERGGKAPGFREWVRRKYAAEPDYYHKLVIDGLMEAATKTWETQPRQKRAPDLFSIAGMTIPEYLTRRTADYDMGEDEEEEYEKVDQQFATLNDLFEDATIKLRNAAKTSAAAEQKMKTFDEARRRARGNMSAFLRDLVD